MTFRVGMKAECIETHYLAEMPPPYPRVGDVLTVNWVGIIDGVEMIDFIEAPNPETFFYYRGYVAAYYRPLVDTKTEISFTQGADPESERYDNRRPVVEPMPVDGWRVEVKT